MKGKTTVQLGQADEHGVAGAEAAPRLRRKPGEHCADAAVTQPLPRVGDQRDAQAAASAGHRRRLVVVVALCAVAVAVVAVAVSVAVGWNGEGRRSPDAAGVAQSVALEADHDVVVQVYPGDGVSAVGERLTELGVVNSAQAFALAAQSRTPPVEAVEPGFYVVSRGRQPIDVVAQFLDPRSRVGSIVVEAGRQLDDVTDPATGAIRQGLLSDIARATCAPTGGGQRCLSVEELRQSAAQSDVQTLRIPDWAREPVTAMAGDYRRLEGLIGVGRWNFDPTATPAQVLSTLIAGSAVRYDQNSLLRTAAGELGLSAYQVLIVASLLQRDGQPGQYRLAAVEIYDRVRGGQDGWQLPPAPVTVPGAEAITVAEHAH